MSIGGLLAAVVAVVLEVVHFALTKDTGLPFLALVLVTLAVLTIAAGPMLAHRGRPTL